MKKILTMGLCSLIFSTYAFANGETRTIREQARGTSAIDEQHLDKLEGEDRVQRQQGKKSVRQVERTRDKLNKNPRNPAFSESFEQVEEDKKRKQEERD